MAHRRFNTTIRCKHCGASEIRKDGFMKGNKRYRCKICDRTFCCGDKREKYTIAQKIRASRCISLRSISRIEGISASLLLYWIRNFGKMLKHKLATTQIAEDCKEVEVLEADELFTYCQKKLKPSTFDLLLIEGDLKLLISK